MPHRSVGIAVLSLPAQCRPQLFLWTPSLASAASSRPLTSAFLRHRYASTKASPAGRPAPRAVQNPFPTQPKSASYSSNKKPSNDKTSTSTAAVPYVEFHSSIDPPKSTLPPPLEVPDRQPGQGKLTHILATGKAYWRFYKAGVKQTWGNMKGARALRRRKQLPFTWYSSLLRTLSSKAPTALSRDPSKMASALHAREGPARIEEHHPEPLHSLTRAEFQFLRREVGDTLRLPVFALILIVFGEWTPALVALFGGIVPKTCRIPRQVRGSLVRRHQKREVRLHRLVVSNRKARLEAMSAGVRNQGNGGDKESMMSQIDRDAIIYALAHRLGTYSALSDVVNLTERRLIKRLRYLDADDALMRRDAGGSSAGAIKELGREEVRIACDERGIDVLRKTGEKDKRGRWLWEEIPDVELRQELKNWLQKGGWKGSAIMEELR